MSRFLSFVVVASLLITPGPLDAQQGQQCIDINTAGFEAPQEIIHIQANAPTSSVLTPHGHREAHLDSPPTSLGLWCQALQ